MECNKDEALRAKDIAEKKFASMDLQGAKRFALKAQSLFPTLEGIAQLITTLHIYLASAVKIAGEKDWYSILSVQMSVDDETLRKQYRKLVLQLHPDKNKSVGADDAFVMVQEAWNVLSDKQKRALYDQRRKAKVFQEQTSQSRKTSASPGAASASNNFAANASASNVGSSKQTVGSATSAVHQSRPWPTPLHRSARAPAALSTKDFTFWTSCDKCHMQYEFPREYLNLNLRCPGCYLPFIAIETPSTMGKHMSEDFIIGRGSVPSRKKMKTMGKDARVGSSSFPSSLGASSFRVPGGSMPISTNRSAYEFQAGVHDVPNREPRAPNHIRLKKFFNDDDRRSILREKGKAHIRNKLNEIKSKPSGHKTLEAF
ncbi:uncharacterized protein LOC133910599 [Phragmites australis]|uniref:uncharacterized protein LOC133910599 n=1 Tax=Phragmites australis TaxID=29695 RepID=UPI002D7700D9|nr:uncharacterized protein LOC133910599 [Phragmites australis]